MKDLNKLVNESINELESIGIKCDFNNIQFKINEKFVRKWGLCHRNPNGSYLISISSRLFDETCPDISTKSTIIHEILHTITWGCGHRGEWKRLANVVNAAGYGYNIKRTSSEEEKGVSGQEIVYKYACRCKKCGKIIKRNRMSEFIRNPQMYHHNKCNGIFERIK